MAFQKVGRLDEIWSGEKDAVLVDGVPVLLVNVNGVVRAYLDSCPHMRTRLSEGQLDKNVLTCAAHHWQFDVLSGQGINPRTACLTEFPVKVEAGEISIEVEQPES